MIIDWQPYTTVHFGSDALIIGKGPNFREGIDYAAEHKGPIIGINEACLYLPDRPATFGISFNDETWPNIAAGHKSQHIIYLMPEKIYRKYKAWRLPDEQIMAFHKSEDDKEILTMEYSDVALRRRLFSHRGTVTSAVHFAWLIGCKNLHFFGFGGSGYAPEFTQHPQQEAIYDDIWETALELCEHFALTPHEHVPARGGSEIEP